MVNSWGLGGTEGSHLEALALLTYPSFFQCLNYFTYLLKCTFSVNKDYQNDASVNREGGQQIASRRLSKQRFKIRNVLKKAFASHASCPGC